MPCWPLALRDAAARARGADAGASSTSGRWTTARQPRPRVARRGRGDHQRPAPVRPGLARSGDVAGGARGPRPDRRPASRTRPESALAPQHDHPAPRLRTRPSNGRSPYSGTPFRGRAAEGERQPACCGGSEPARRRATASGPGRRPSPAGVLVAEELGGEAHIPARGRPVARMAARTPIESGGWRCRTLTVGPTGPPRARGRPAGSSSRMSSVRVGRRIRVRNRVSASGLPYAARMAQPALSRSPGRV